MACQSETFRPVRIYRLGTRAFPVWDGAGAAAVGGRWNPVGIAVIYAAGSLALAMLERLVQRQKLGETVLVEAIVPDDVAIENLLTAPPANWQALGSPEAMAAGGEWATSRRTALLRVPSAVVPREPNYLVNPAHNDAARIVVGAVERLQWDYRLFGLPAPT